MGGDYAETFSALRPEVLERLISVRASIDHAYATLPDVVIREQFDVVLGKMQHYLVTEDLELYREFLARWAAMRVGEGFAPENLMHSVVAMCDVVVRVGRDRLGPTPECSQFVRAVTRLGFVAARLLVENLAADLERRTHQLREMGASQ
jgi:hypothetical protein